MGLLEEATDHGEKPAPNHLFFLLELGSMGDPLWSSLFLKAFPMKGTHAGATPGELQPMGRTSCCSSYRTVSCWRGPHARAGEFCEEEEAAEMWCYELTATTILHPPAPLKVGMRE